MSWPATADHERFEEAAGWFRNRVPYTAEELGKLDDKARAHAFWIAGGLELSAVQTVFDEIAKSIDKGGSLEDFKRSIRDVLGSKLGIAGHHLETVFRNATQSAYNAGRWYQLTDPELKLGRPYLLYDAILDSRTTPLCNTLNGTVKVVEDPFWLSHWPPLHHRCRSSPRSLTRREAARRGITEGAPDAKVPDGFGLAPPARGDEPPKPDPTRIDPSVWTAYKQREGDLQRELAEAQRKAQEARRRQDPQHWFDSEYRAKYGEDAGRAVAWGRAMEERGKAVSMAEAKRQYQQLTEDIGVSLGGNPTPLFARLRAAAEDGFIPADLKSLGDVADALSGAIAKTPSLKGTLDEVRALAAMIGHRAGIQQAGDAVKLRAPPLPKDAPQQLRDVSDEIVQKARAFWAELSDKSLVLPDKRKGYVIRWDKARAHYDHAARIVYTQWIEQGQALADTGFSTIVHEMAHGVEHHNDRARRSAEEFLERRTAGEVARPMSALMPDRSWAAHEVAKRDRFISPYMGKQYVNNVGRRYATEVSSMALEEMHRNSANLVDQDEETFWFGLGQLAGDSVKK